VVRVAILKAPSAPSNLNVKSEKADNVTLAWSYNSKEAKTLKGFRLERRKGEEEFVEIADLANNSKTYTDSRLMPNTKYDYRIRAYASSGYSAYSNTITFIVKPPLIDGISLTALRPTCLSP